jgi:hypothetical protein
MQRVGQDQRCRFGTSAHEGHHFVAHLPVVHGVAVRVAHRQQQREQIVRSAALPPLANRVIHQSVQTTKGE